MPIPSGFKLANPEKATEIIEKEPIAPTVKTASAIPQGFILAEQQAITPEEPGLLSSIADAFTGESKMTDRIAGLDEIGSAPELNRLSGAAFKTSLGLLTTGKTSELKSILKKQFGEKVSFDKDEKGNEIVELPSGEFALNKPGLSGQDLIRGVFDIAAFTPAGRASKVMGAAAGAGATQGAIEGTSSLLGGSFDIGDLFVSSLTGGVFKGAENLAGAGLRAVRGTPQNEIVEAGKAANIPVMTSDVLPPTTFLQRQFDEFAEKIPVVGTASEREIQQAQREAAVHNIAERYTQFSYDSIVDSLKKQTNRIKQAAGGVLQATGEKLDRVGRIPLTNTQRSIDDAIDMFNRPGVIQSNPAINDMNVLIDAIEATPQTFSTLTENATAFREIVKGADKAERSQLSTRAKSVLEGIQQGLKKDLVTMARQELNPTEFRKWKRANDIYFDQAVNLTKSKTKLVLDKGDVTPEVVENMLFSKRPSEVTRLFKSLDFKGKENARVAVIDKVFTTLSKRVDGITPSSFATEMKKQGVAIDTFFKGERRQELDGLIKVLDATRRGQIASLLTPTGQQLLVPGAVGFVASGGAAGSAGAVGAALTLSAANKIYQTPVVRDLLLRINSVDPGSSNFIRLAAEFNKKLIPIVQATLVEQEHLQEKRSQ